MPRIWEIPGRVGSLVDVKFYRGKGRRAAYLGTYIVNDGTLYGSTHVRLGSGLTLESARIVMAHAR